jgi:hypothetical protein
MKSFKNRNPDMMKGEDMKDNKAMIERKGKKMFEKIKANKSGGFKSKDKDGKRIYSPKTQAKMEQGYTRSKMITRIKKPPSAAAGKRGGAPSRGRGGSARGGARGGKGKR